MKPRFVVTITEGMTKRPACGPKLSDCSYTDVVVGNCYTIYTCRYCGDQEGL